MFALILVLGISFVAAAPAHSSVYLSTLSKRAEQTPEFVDSSATCGGISVGASEESTATTGPNGSIEWLNCGVDDVGWNPPVVHVDDLKYVDLDTALQSGNSPFKACSTYVNLFKKHGKANGLPPILLAAFAMQESNCNPSAPTGGLMQITSDKCGEAPNGDCNEPDYNIGTAAKYFKTTLDQQNGDVLLTTGHYNGWFQGMTIAKATKIKGSCCRCQQNLDYLHQFFNGWLQNVNPYSASPRMGKYFNLDSCK